eukprot:UN05921
MYSHYLCSSVRQIFGRTNIKDQTLVMTLALTGGTFMAASPKQACYFLIYFNPFWWCIQCIVSQLDEDTRNDGYNLRDVMEYMGADHYNTCNETVFYFLGMQLFLALSAIYYFYYQRNSRDSKKRENLNLGNFENNLYDGQSAQVAQLEPVEGCDTPSRSRSHTIEITT